MTQAASEQRTKESLIDEVGFSKYFQGKRWADLNRQFFDQLAPKYDRLNLVLSFGRHGAIKRAAVRRLSVPPRAKILDLCTGSGDIAFLFAQREPEAEITALDASPVMLRVAQEKSAGRRNITFVEGDALRLPYPDNSFDGVFIGFGLRNLDGIDAGLKEMIRVVRPGGWVSILDLGKPQGKIRRVLYALYFERLIPFLGRHIFHRGEFNSFEYLPKSNRYFLSPQETADRMRSLGLSDVCVTDYLLGGISQQTGTKVS